MATNKEEEAQERGWVPKEEWVEAGHDPEDWVDAKEFIYRGSLMERISSQSGQLRSIQQRMEQMSKKNEELANALRTMGEHNQKLAEVEYKKALRDMRKQASEATAEGEHEMAAEIEEKIADLQEQAKSQTVDTGDAGDKATVSDSSQGPYSSPEDLEVLTKWAEENKAWLADDAMRAYAEAVGRTLDPSSMSSKEYLGAIKNKMVETFPDKLGKKRKPAAVTEPDANGSADKSYKAKTKYTVSDLSADQRQVMKHLIESGAPLTQQEYIDQLASLGEIG